MGSHTVALADLDLNYESNPPAFRLASARFPCLVKCL